MTLLNNIWKDIEGLPRNTLNAVTSGQSPQNFSGLPNRGIDKTGQRIAVGAGLAAAGAGVAGAGGAAGAAASDAAPAAAGAGATVGEAAAGGAATDAALAGSDLANAGLAAVIGAFLAKLWGPMRIIEVVLGVLLALFGIYALSRGADS